MISTFFLPTSVLCGEGSLGALPEELASRAVTRPLLVTDAGVLRGAVFQRIRRLLPHAELFDEIANPSEKGVLDGAELYVTAGCDGIVALGGGTVLDAAKAIRLKVHHPLPLAEYAVKNATEEMPVLVSIPTTAGTGSEVSASAMILLEGKGRKIRISSPRLAPSVAIIDPELTLDLPDWISAGSGMNALARCVEAYLSTRYHPLCDAMACEGARLALQGLARVMANPKDVEARRDMMLAAAAGAMASQKAPGIIDAMANVLAAPGAMHHGTAVAVLLPEVLAFLEPGREARFEAIARHGGTPGITQAVADVIALTGIAPKLSHHGINGDMLPACARMAFEDLSLHGPPRCTQADLLAIYRRAW